MMPDNAVAQKRPAHQDPTDDGLRARGQGKSRDVCPHPLGSEERHEWLEGYDGVDAEGASLVPDKRV
jgi:ribosome modulation factor